MISIMNYSSGRNKVVIYDTTWNSTTPISTQWTENDIG